MMDRRFFLSFVVSPSTFLVDATTLVSHTPPQSKHNKLYNCNTMKTAAVLTLLVGSAAAFAPQQASRASTSLAAFESELGAQPPLGFW